METVSLLAVNALNGGGGGGGGDVTPDGITTEFNGSEELQANAVIHVNALPSSNVKANSLYHVTETVTYTDEEEVEHTFTMGKLFRYESGEWVSYTTVSGLSEADYDHLTSAQKNDGSTYVLNGSGHVVRTSTASINDVDVVGDLTGTDLKLVNEDDFVTTPTGKTDGIEIVTPVGTPTSPIVLSEIDDTAAMKYSSVHTSSNDYINHRLDAINESLVGKLSIQFVAALPASPTRNTQYYVETATEGVWDIYVVDNSGTVRSMGSTEIDLTGYQKETDNRLATTSKSVVGAINENKAAIDAEKLSAQAVSTVTASTKLSGVDLTTHKSMDLTVDLLTQYVANKFFPVGSLYTTTSGDNPNTILGVGTWEIVATNRVLWGVDAATTAGKQLEEQLPNMKGTLGGVVTYNKSSTTGVGTGVFSQSKGEGNSSTNQISGATMGFTKFDFNAYYSSTVYKDNASVRPNAYTVHIWKRTA